MKRRSRIRAFLLGLLIGGGSWTAAAHDDAPAQNASGDGVVSDCATECVAETVDHSPQALVDVGETVRAATPKPAGSTAAPSRPRFDLAYGRIEARAFIHGIEATIGPPMSGTPPLGVLSGSS